MNQPVHAEVANFDMAVGSAESEPPACIRFGIPEIEDPHSVAIVLDAFAERHKLHCLAHVRLEQHVRTVQVMLGQQRAQFGIADVAAESRGRIAVAALAHIVSAELIVIGKLPRSFGGEQVAGRSRVRGHPECVQIAHAVVGAAGLDHSGLVLNQHRSRQLGPEPDRAARRNIQGQLAGGRCHHAGFFQFGCPA